MPKIARLETFSNEFVCFVRTTTDSGAVGWGQTSTYNADITATIFHRQVAPWALGSKLTVAVNCCVALIGIRADPGETETLIAGTVMFAEPDFEESANEVAVIVTVKLLAGALAGAW